MKKRVLLICKEGFSWPSHYLAKVLADESVEVAAFFIMPHESLRGDYDYREFCRLNPGMKIFTAEKLGLDFLGRVKSGKLGLDENYLDFIDRNYCRLKTLGLQQVSSQFMSTYAHYRTYYRDVPHDQQLLLMQMYYRMVEEILYEFKPNAIYDADFSEYPRTILFEVASSRGIPYATIEGTRFKDYFFPSPTLATSDADWLSPLVKKRDSEIAGDPDRASRVGSRELKAFRARKKILADGFQAAFATMNFRPLKGLVSLLRAFVHRLPIQVRDWFRFYRNGTAPIFADPVRSNLLEFKEYLRKLVIQFSSPFQSVDLSKLNYVLFPLHLIPESSTLSKSPFFLNEEFLIESLSKSVRPGQKIVVKEHWYMLGERPLSFYRRLKRYPNVILIEPRKYGDPRAYLENAEGVVTITGTTAFEAALLGKPSIIFGPTPFSMLKSVKHITDVTKLPGVLRTWKERLSNDSELEAYIEIAQEVGQELDMPMLTSRENETDALKATAQAARLYELFKFSEKLSRENKLFSDSRTV